MKNVKGKAVWAAGILAALAGAGIAFQTGNYPVTARKVLGIFGQVIDRVDIVEQAQASQASVLEQVVADALEVQIATSNQVAAATALKAAADDTQDVRIEALEAAADTPKPEPPIQYVPAVLTQTVVRVERVVEKILVGSTHTHPKPAPRTSRSSKGIR